MARNIKKKTTKKSTAKANDVEKKEENISNDDNTVEISNKKIFEKKDSTIATNEDIKGQGFIELSKNPADKSITKFGVFLVVAVILIGLVLFYVSLDHLGGSGPTIKSGDTYNGFKFFKDSAGYWNVEIKTIYGDQVMPFYYHPNELIDLVYDKKINTGVATVQKNTGNVVVSFGTELLNPDLPNIQDPGIAAFEINKIFNNVLGMQTKGALTSEFISLNTSNQTNSSQVFPVINCDNSSINQYVFEFRLGEEEYIKSKGDYCAVIMVKDPANFIKYADFLMFKLIRIIPLS